MKKIICLLTASLLLLLPLLVMPQSKKQKHRAHRKVHRTHHTHKTSRRKPVPHTTGARIGLASFYSNRFSGRKTASGEKFSQKRLTAAYNAVPLGTMIRVVNLKNNRTVVVKVNDRLHHRNRRLVDLSKAAAMQLKMMAQGVVKVKILVLRKIR